MSDEPATVVPLEPEPKPDFLKQRLLSLDAYRGLIMVTLAFSGFGLEATAKRHIAEEKAPGFWEAVRYQFSHAEWAGCGYWDLIQPSFMFMVGAAAAYSFAKRRSSGQSAMRLFLHTLMRSIILVFLGIFLISNGRRFTEWSLMNVLTQIGLGYPFLYLLWGRSFRIQAFAAVCILVGTWLMYVLYPHPGIDLSTGNDEAGIKKEWGQEYLAGIDPVTGERAALGYPIAPAWHKNANVGHAIDLWLLNLLPQHDPAQSKEVEKGEKPAKGSFQFNSGGYQTINFIPSLATMLFGLMCGELLRSRRLPSQKLNCLLAAGVAGLILGQALNLTGICPLVKRIWTPSWALFSTGWCCLLLACFYGVIDVLEYKGWAWPLIVVGVNSIAIYCMGMLLRGWTSRMLRTHLGEDVFLAWGPLWEPFVQNMLAGLVFWLMCLWMYRQKIFIRV